MDEVHFQQHGSRCRMWIPPECRDPVLRHAPTRKSIGYWGAVRLRDGLFVYRRETNVFNAKTCQQFLVQLHEASRTQDQPGKQVVVISDNARFHHATLHKEWREAQSPEFRLDFLPPYSPELNPTERIWKLTRRNAVHNRYFSTIAEVVNTIEDQFGHWAEPNDILRRLCAIT